MFVYFFFLRQSFCMQLWLSGICHVEKAIPKLRDPLASTSRMLGLKEHHRIWQDQLFTILISVRVDVCVAVRHL